MAQITISSIVKSGETHVVTYTADFVVETLFYQISMDNINWGTEVAIGNTTSPIVLTGLGASSFYLRLGARKSVRSTVYGPQYQ